MNMEDATWAHEQRQQRARMMRREQLQRYEGREREQPAGRAARRRRRKSGNRVAFGAREVVRDAVLHCNNEEGRNEGNTWSDAYTTNCCILLAPPPLPLLFSFSAVKMIMDSRLASPNTSIEANGASLLHLVSGCTSFLASCVIQKPLSCLFAETLCMYRSPLSFCM